MKLRRLSARVRLDALTALADALPLLLPLLVHLNPGLTRNAYAPYSFFILQPEEVAEEVIHEYAGIRRTYTFTIPEGNATTIGARLSFYLRHTNAHVEIEGSELTYDSAEAADSSHIGHTPGNYWVSIPVRPVYAGKAVRVTLTPVYGSLRDLLAPYGVVMALMHLIVLFSQKPTRLQLFWFLPMLLALGLDLLGYRLTGSLHNAPVFLGWTLLHLTVRGFGFVRSSLRKEQLLRKREDELRHTQAYLGAETMLYGEKLSVTYDTPHTAFRLPALTLQPIVENSVKHGMSPDHPSEQIVIRTRQLVNGNEIVIEDNGAAFPRGRAMRPQAYSTAFRRILSASTARRPPAVPAARSRRRPAPPAEDKAPARP